MTYARDKRRDRFPIDQESVASYRLQLQEMACGFPIVEAAVEGFSDWQVVEAMERLWEACSEDAPDAALGRRPELD